MAREVGARLRRGVVGGDQPVDKEIRATRTEEHWAIAFAASSSDYESVTFRGMGGGRLDGLRIKYLLIVYRYFSTYFNLSDSRQSNGCQAKHRRSRTRIIKTNREYGWRFASHEFASSPLGWLVSENINFFLVFEIA
jgi:hypothetical protein